MSVYWRNVKRGQNLMIDDTAGLEEVIGGYRENKRGIDAYRIYDRDINLRIGFRFLHQLMNRFDGNLHYALLAYNRGPTTVREILAQGGNPSNGYAEKVVGK